MGQKYFIPVTLLHHPHPIPFSFSACASERIDSKLKRALNRCNFGVNWANVAYDFTLWTENKSIIRFIFSRNLHLRLLDSKTSKYQNPSVQNISYFFP